MDQLLAALQLVTIALLPNGERRTRRAKSQPRVKAVFNYTIGRAVTNYLLVGKFGPAGTIVRLSMES